MFRSIFVRLSLCCVFAVTMASCQAIGSILKLPFSILGSLTGSGSGGGMAMPRLANADRPDDAVQRGAEVTARGTYRDTRSSSILESDRVALRRDAAQP